ncbi:MAG TPA: HAMP domain-containing sensor histidine kinase [Thermoanaerobaculia bacterium]|jgi:signal transduction histidine kinase
MTASPSSTASPEGIALLCAPDGTVRKLVLSNLTGADPGESLCASVDAASTEACAIFLRSAARAGFARSMPLRLGTRDVHCFGLCADDELRVVAVVDLHVAAEVADAAELPDLAREIRRTESTYELYEQLARVNNELVTAQRELARTVAELKRLNAYKDEILGMAAHDLRNPLAANAAFVTFLLEDSQAMTEDNVMLLERLRSNSRYMLRLVNDVLDFAAIESGRVRLNLEETPLEPLVRDVVETMRIIAVGKQVTVRFSVEGAVPELAVDRIKLSQAVQNLVGNAVQYSPAGASVDVRLRGGDGGVTIEVEDRGPGIPPEEVSELFKPFRRLSTASLAAHRSVGLGLAIVRRQVEAHGGTIQVRSEVGKGSVFTIHLRTPAA